MIYRPTWAVLCCLFAFFVATIPPALAIEPMPLEPAPKTWPTIEHHSPHPTRMSPRAGCNQQPHEQKKAPWPMILVLGAFFLLHATGYARVPTNEGLKQLRDP